MKKFYMILAALLIGSVCFAQKSFQLLENYTTTQPVSAQRSDYVGNQTGTSVFPVTAGHAIIIRGEQFSTEYSVGNTITEVKFTTCDPANIVDGNGNPVSTYADYTNNSFTIKIYENGVYSSGYTTSGGIVYQDGCLGTVAHSQSYTQTAYGDNIVELTSPYTIGSANFWISVECTGNTIFLCKFNTVGSPLSMSTYQTEMDPSLSSQNYIYTSYEQISETEYAEVVNNNYTLMQASASTVQGYNIELRLSFFVNDGGGYQATSDLEAIFLDTYPNPTGYAPTAMTLNLTDNLTVYPMLINAGNDATNGTITIDLKIDNESVLESPMTTTQSIASGGGMTISFAQGEYSPFSLTAAQMDQFGLTNFNICLVVTYVGTDGSIDPDLENNTTCISVTRTNGETSVEENVAEAVSVYPNPANDMFTVANAEGATIVVVNSLGQVVATIENAASNQTIDASNFANGTYFVKVNEEVVRINVVK